jgi:hypothetical protein
MKTKGPPSSTAPAENDLPPECAFVLQLRRPAAAEPGFAGRIEHVSSGRSTKFRSLADVGDFVRRVLGGSARESAAHRATRGTDESST